MQLADLKEISKRLAEKNYGNYDPPKNNKKDSGNSKRGGNYHDPNCRYNSPCPTCKSKGY